MPRKRNEIIEGISDKLEYLGLNLDKIPENLKEYEPLEYRIPKVYDEKRYRQYRYVDIDDIQILLSPTNRLDDLEEKYKKASPLADYLDQYSEKNLIKYTTFLSMLRNIDTFEINKIEKEQQNLNREIPFKVKFNGNYLWQIYYSENTNKYFMIVPTQDTDYSTFFYLLRKKLEGKKHEKIFVPISNIKYSNKYLKRQEFEELENYLWLFTKDWPLIYEVYNKHGELTIQIIGETNVYEKIKTIYKVELKTRDEAIDFYKLLKALYILQTELPSLYKFETNIDKKGSLELYFQDEKIEYRDMIEFIREQYKIGIKAKKAIRAKIKEYDIKLKKLKEIVAAQEIEYLAKEKQISTFLECKKSFFGKVKYYFKYSKKSSKKKEENEEIPQQEEVNIQENVEEIKKEKKKANVKRIYTLEELITNYRELLELENNMKNLLMDVNALKLKAKNMDKKIENATMYIEEIDKHKKSIFEFWKYSNKDEMESLPEGEEEEINVVKKIERVFDYNDDIEELGQKLDRMQRKAFSEEDLNNVYISTTGLINILNSVKNNEITAEELEENLSDLKSKLRQLKLLSDEEYDIFGNIIENTAKERKINNKRHREIPRDMFDILDINRNTKIKEYLSNVQSVIKGIIDALEKGIIPEDIPVYKAMDNVSLNSSNINVFNINPENEMRESIKRDGKKINLYKINLKEGTKGIGFTNIVFYSNNNKTLPIGMDLSTKLLVDIDGMQLNLVNQKTFKIINIEDEENDFSNIEVKDVNVVEYEIAKIGED